MISSAAGKPASLNETQKLARKPTSLVGRKIWLPKLLYNALPYFYVLSGLMALLATVYVSDWFWVLPHYLMFSAACLHMGVLVYRRRSALRRKPGSVDLQ